MRQDDARAHLLAAPSGGSAATRGCAHRCVTTPSLTGTFRSSRIRTRLPARSRSLMRSSLHARCACLGRPRPGERGVEHAVGEAPLVVVPGAHLDQRPAMTLVMRRIEDRGVRVVVEVDRHQRRLGVGQDALRARPSAAAFISSLISSTLVARLAMKVRSTSDTLMVGTRMAKPSSLPLSSGSTSPTAAAAPVLVGIIECVAERARRRSLVVDVGQHLVVGIGMHGGHQAADDADRIVQHLGQRRQAVGGARGVGDHRVDWT